MVLVGHSLGAYVRLAECKIDQKSDPITATPLYVINWHSFKSAAYLIRYSSRVERVFFCDPWGWATFNPDIAAYTYNERPFVQRLLITFIIFIGTIFTPLVILRMFGKFGVTVGKCCESNAISHIVSRGISTARDSLFYSNDALFSNPGLEC